MKKRKRGGDKIEGGKEARYLLLDSFVLLGIVNTKLRDFYPSLADLCYDLGIDREKLEEKLAGVGFRYNEEINQFVSMF